MTDKLLPQNNCKHNFAHDTKPIDRMLIPQKSQPEILNTEITIRLQNDIQYGIHGNSVIPIKIINPRWGLVVIVCVDKLIIIATFMYIYLQKLLPILSIDKVTIAL